MTIVVSVVSAVGIPALVMGGATLGAGFLGYEASTKASQQQAQAAQAASQQISQGQTTATNAITNLLGPYAQAGQAELPTIQSLINPGPNQTAALSQTPGFQFMQDWGQKGVTAQATTRGLGGNALTAGAQYATGLAGTQWQNILAPLLNIYGAGSGAASNASNYLANVATGSAGSQAAISQGLGNTNAAGTIGSLGALGGGLGGIGNIALLQALSGGKGLFGGNQNQTSPYGTPPAPVNYAGGPFQGAYG